jgi:hypothetical protein
VPLALGALCLSLLVGCEADTDRYDRLHAELTKACTDAQVEKNLAKAMQAETRCKVAERNMNRFMAGH